MIDRRRLIRSSVGAAALAAVAPSLAAARAPAADAALDAAFGEVQPVALAGGIVARDGLAWSGVRGLRRDGDEVAVTSGDRWHLGSNTKAMTAALWARLVEQGRARWGMPVSEIFDDVAVDPAWADATLDDFMHHRAGLADASVIGPDWLRTARADPRSLPAQRRAVVEQALKAPPAGDSGLFQYGNANYILIGAAIEAVTGRAWEEVMRTELFAPLGLSSAGFGPPPGDNAWGHRRSGEAAALPMDPASPGADNPLALGPAGTAHMTLEEYARFLRVFLREGDGWLSAETTRRLTTPPPGGRYAMGWIVLPPQPWARGPAIAHEGSNTMWRATALVDPEGGRAFICLSNDGGRGGPACQALMRGLIAAA